MRRNSGFALVAFCLFVLSSDEAFAGGPLDDLANGFEHACLASADKSPEFSKSKVETGFKKSTSKTSLLVSWKPERFCSVKYHFIQNVMRGTEVSAKVQNLAVKFASRVGGTVKIKRKGKRNEVFEVEVPPRSYTIYADSKRSGEVNGLSIVRY
ncbi:hypothetical protein [Roseovarius nubinhibens]|uniref:hypothetical protein n=1 Tax=Roseovarius nubinhibens TaxID=314263 RepID=UPI0030EBE241